MITYVNSSNSAKYSALFNRASADLMKQGIDVVPGGISSLDEYFAYIRDLSKIDRQYTILPVDEEVFDINADTRVISIPASFRTNGIGVQGDEVAEILYFRIDRFFDATDLNNMEVYVQWETAPDAQGVCDQGVSKEWVRDITSEPGKIIFGWPLSSAITSRAGKIKFSVRFYQWTDENKQSLSYSFSTLTATATINPALDFSIDTVGGITIDDVSSMIEQRFVNSQVSGGAMASDPIYLTNLTVSKNLDENGVAILRVQAVSPDAGNITYEWKMDKGGVTPINGNVVYLATEDSTRNPSKLYYVVVGEDQYEIYTGNDFSEGNRSNIYEKFAQYTASETGQYYAIASNRVALSHKEKTSVICEIPGPKTLNITSNVIPTGILREQTGNTVALSVTAVGDGQLTYQWYQLAEGASQASSIEGAIGNTYSAAEDGRYYVVVTNTLNKDEMTVTSSACRVTHPAEEPIISLPSANVMVSLASLNSNNTLAPTIANTNRFDSLTYEWYDYNGSDFSSINSTPEDVKVGVGPTFLPTSKDTFYVKVTGQLNGTTATSQSHFWTTT